MFFRKKTVNGSDYWYLVENKRENGKVRQRVIKYIGNQEQLDKFKEGMPK